jgi:hypothetical protein
MILYHGTATKDVPRILKHGLVPSLARDARDLDPPKAVWLTSMYNYARLNARGGTVLLVDVTGMDLVQASFGVWYSLEPIPAKRISEA